MRRPIIVLVNLCFVACVTTKREPVKLRIETAPRGATIEVKRGESKFERIGTSPTDISVTRVRKRNIGPVVGATITFIGALATIILGGIGLSQDNETALTGALFGAGVTGIGWAVATANRPRLPPDGLSEELAVRFSKPGFEPQTFVVDPFSPMLATSSATIALALPPAVTRTSTPAAGPSVAVLPIDDPADVLAPELREDLRDGFAARLGAYGYSPAPLAKTDDAIAAGAEPCIDEICRQALAEALGTQIAVSPRVINLGPLCITAAALYETSTSTATDAASEETNCDPEDMEAGFDDVAYRLRPPPPPIDDGSALPPLPPWALEQIPSPAR